MTPDDLRSSLRAEVVARVPVDQRESDSIAAFLTAYDGLPEPFSEEADPVHVTGSAIVVGPRGTILHRHKRLGIWLQLGGHIDPGELPWNAAVREVLEESGLDVRHPDGGPQLVHVDVHPGPRGHTHLDLRYLLLAGDENPRPPEGESQDVRWFEWCEALGRAEPGVIGAFESQQTGSIRLRRARHDDGPAVGHIHATSFRTYLPTVPQIHDDADIERYFSGLVDTQECWIAEEDGSPIGFCILRVDDGSVRNDDGDTPADDGDVHWLDHLYLAAGHTGRGAGSQLVRLAKERRPGGLQLWTFQVNAGARRFYEGHGFVASEFTGGAGNEEYTPDVRYLWRPTP